MTTMDASNDRRAGYQQALDDMYSDGLLPLNEYNRRVAELSQSTSEPNPSTPGAHPPTAAYPKEVDDYVHHKDHPAISKFLSSNQKIPKYKICLVGDCRVGKTAYFQRLRTKKFEHNYIHTKGIDSLYFVTSQGPVEIELWDVRGEEGNIGDSFYESHGFILMFDVTSRMSYKNLGKWYNLIRKDCPDAPIVLVGTKVEAKERQIKPRAIIFHRKKNIEYYDISAKIAYNLEKPFLHLLRSLTGDRNLTLISSGEKLIPEASNVSLEQLAKFEQEMRETAEFYDAMEDDEEEF